MLKDKSTEDRLTQLQELRDVLAEAIDRKPGMRDLSQLAKQYRDTVKEIDELVPHEEEDPIAEILQSGSRRSIRSKIYHGNFIPEEEEI